MSDHCRRCRRLRRLLALEMREAGKPFKEIGAALGITTAAAHKIYRTALKARAKVRAAANEHGGDTFVGTE